MRKVSMAIALLAAVVPWVSGQPPVKKDDDVDRARGLWRMRQTRSAIDVLRRAADDPAFARRADAWLLLGDIYFYRGWESENAFPGWHEEPEYRPRATAAFRAAAAARPGWSVPQERLAQVDLVERLGLAALLKERAPQPPDEADVLAARLAAYQADASAPIDEIVAAINARVKARPDPGAFLTGANLLVARKARLDKAIALAEASIPAAERFIDENAGAYKLADKARSTLTRSRTSATDLIGWVYFLEKDLQRAEAKLLEAERLSRGQDLANQFHLGELARAKGDLASAREHDLAALTLSGPSPTQAEAKKRLAEVYAGLGNGAAGFDAYLDAELARRREARRADLVRSLVDRPAPALALTDVAGKALDLAALRGKVVLLNFFSSW